MSDWLITPVPRPQAPRVLVVFHHAGGQASSYVPWVQALGASWEVALVEMPGRGLHRGAAAPLSVYDAGRTLADAVERQAAGRPLVLFGHSMGGLLAYQSALCLEALAEVDVAGVVVSSILPTSYKFFQTEVDLEMWCRALEATEALPPAVVDSSRSQQAFRQLLRQDCRLISTFRPAEQQLINRLVVCGGDRDQLVPYKDLAAWQGYGVANAAYGFAGGHHYWQQHLAPLATIFDELTGPGGRDS